MSTKPIDEHAERMAAGRAYLEKSLATLRTQLEDERQHVAVFYQVQAEIRALEIVLKAKALTHIEGEKEKP